MANSEPSHVRSRPKAMYGYHPNGLRTCEGHRLAWTDVAAGRYPVAHATTDRRTVAFARVSLNEQVRAGCSLYQQINSAAQEAQRGGKQVSVLYLDPGKSATRLTLAKRPGVNTLLTDIRSGSIGTLIVYKRDRIARQPLEWFEFLKVCARHSVQIRFTCPGEPPVGQGTYGRFMESVLIAAAQLETEVTGMRIRDIHLGLLRKGRPCGSVPYGYRRMADGTIVQQPEEAEVVATAFKLVIDEKLGIARIALRLNQAYPKSCRGKDWGCSHVHRILQNRIYAGFVHIRTRDGKERRQYQECRSDLIPAIVTEAAWNEAKQIRTVRCPLPKADPKSGACVRLLTGLLVCPECGRTMYTRGTVGYQHRLDGTRGEYRGAAYRCNVAHLLDQCPNRKQVTTAKVDQAAIRAVTQALSELDADGLLAELVERRAQQRQLLESDFGKAQAELCRVNAEIERVQRSIEETPGPALEEHFLMEIRMLLEERAELHEKRDQIQQRSSGLTAPADEELALEAAKAWPQDFESLPLEDQRRLLGRIVKRVV